MFGKPIDQRSDIYSLGVVLYEMATGHRPYSADNPLDVVLALSRSLLKPTGVEAHLSPEVSDVIAKMLAVKVEDRYQSAAEVEAAITALIAPDLVLVDPRLATTSRILKLVKILIAVATVPLVVTALGFLTTAWFNHVLDRNPPFSVESWTVWFEIGIRSLFTPFVVIGGILFAVEAIRFVIRLLRLSPKVDSVITASRAHTLRLSSRLNFDDPVVMGQAVSAVGLLAFVAIVWRFRALLRAVETFVSVDPSRNFALLLAPLRPHHLEDAGLYRVALEILLLFLSISIIRIVRLRSRQTIRQGGGALAMVTMLFVLALLAAEIPYRFIWKNNFERINVGQDRCYAIGESGSQLLTFCPDVPPPRTRIVGRDNPVVQRSGTFESIFTPAEESR